MLYSYIAMGIHVNLVGPSGVGMIVCAFLDHDSIRQARKAVRPPSIGPVRIFSAHDRV